jgi:hypothetical protein
MANKTTKNAAANTKKIYQQSEECSVMPYLIVKMYSKDYLLGGYYGK